MTWRRVRGPALAGALVIAGSMWSHRSADVIVVRAGDPLQRALDAAPAGATVRLASGTHLGPVTIRKPLVLEGEREARLEVAGETAPLVTVSADGIRVRDLRLRGGFSGVLVREAEEVVLEHVIVSGSYLHGIEVVDASAHITGVDVGSLRHPMAQGIEVRNSEGRPQTVVEGSSIATGQEGIVSHVSEVLIRDNEVRGTTMRAIAITEMSDGVVAGNAISGAAGTGLYCGDMSRCQFQDNVVEKVSATAGGTSRAGWGLLITYHARASSEGDALEGAAGAKTASLGGHLTPRSPLEPGPGSRGLWAALAASAIALGLLLLLWLVLGPAIARSRFAPRAWRWVGWLAPLVPALLVTGVAVQTFHMIEHVLQVFRVRIDGVPGRGGIAGPVVDAEWVHFFYNVGVLSLIVLVVVARLGGWGPSTDARRGDRWIVAALLIQGYHVIEHSAKLMQHLHSGAKVNPGLAGGAIDLVLLHFALNLAVYAAASAATYRYLRRERRSVRSLSSGRRSSLAAPST